MINEVRQLLDLREKELPDFGITKEEFVAWEALPATNKILQALQHKRQFLAEGLAIGDTLGDKDETVQHTNRVVGIIAGLDIILRLEYVEDGEDDENGGEDG